MDQQLFLVACQTLNKCMYLLIETGSRGLQVYWLHVVLLTLFVNLLIAKIQRYVNVQSPLKAA